MKGNLQDDRDRFRLHAACASGSLDEIKALIAQGHDAHATDANKQSLLHVAVESARLAIIEYLLDEVKLSIHAADQFRETLLHVAVQTGDVQVVEYLINNGADKAPRVRCPNRSPWGNSAQKFDSCPEDLLVVAARHGTLEMIEYLVDHGFPIDPTNLHQRPLQEIAIRKGDVKMVDLITRAAADLLATNSTEVSMICLASKHGGLDMVEYFINKGVWEDGHLLLCAAVEGDQIDVVQYFATMRVSLHTTDRVSGKNLLHVAVEFASMNMIKYLISKHVDATGTTRDGKTLIHAAIERGDMEIVQYLMSLRTDFELIAKDELSSLLAVRSGNVETIEFVLDNGAPLTSVGKDGYSLAHFAVWRDSIPLLELLEKRGLNLQDCDSTQKPILAVAVRHASVDVIKYLVAKGISLNETDKTGKSYLVLDPDLHDLTEDEFIVAARGRALKAEHADGKFSLLHSAAQRGAVDIIQYLADEGLDAHTVDRRGRALLHVAVEANLETVNYLLKRGANPNDVDMKGVSVLHYAVQAGKKDIVETLVSNGVDILDQNASAPSLLAIGVKQRNLEVMKILLEKGLPLDVTNEQGESLLHIAVASSNREMVEVLLENGATWNGNEDNLTSHFPLSHVAVANQDVVLLDYLWGHGFDIRGVDSDGNTALHVALRHQIPPVSVNVKLITYLCEQQLDVNAIGKRGNTPLHISCSMGDTESSELLLQRGSTASLTVRNKDGLVPLHVASQHWDSVLIKILVEAGAQVDATSTSGLTPLGAALSSRRLPLERANLQRLYSSARVLCSHGATWSTDCEESLETWPQLMHTQLEQQWSKDSSWSSGKESEPDSSITSELDPQHQLKLLDRDLEDALSVKKGLRACIHHWSREHLQGKDRLTEIPIQVLARGQEVVETYLRGLTTSDASQLLYRRKICVAGPTKWGKTSLIKSVTSSRSQQVPDGDRTIGIDLFSCSFIEEHDDTVKCHDVTFWDFAGQDGYQVVHSVFFSRQTFYLVCVDLDIYTKSLALGGKEARSNRQSEAELSRFVGRSVFSWIRLIFARQPDAEMIFVGTKADMLKDSTQLRDVKQDLQVRLTTWKRRLEKEIDALSIGDFQQTTLLNGFGDALHSAKLAEKLKMQVTKLLTSEWLVVSTIDETAVDQAWDALAERITTSERCFVMPDMHARVLKAIRTKQAAAAKLLNGKDRIERSAIPVHALCKMLMNELDGLDSDECIHILHTLHEMGDILFFEDAHVGPLQDIVIVDPLLVLDLMREVINHDQMGGNGVVADDGRVAHALLMTCHLWKDMDSELVYAFKLLLQYYQVAYPSDGSTMDWDSDLIVPSYWKSQKEPIHPMPLFQQQSSIQRRGLEASVYLCWDYDVSAEVSETLFEQFAVVSHTPLFERRAWQNCIESFVKGEFASRLELSPGPMNFDIIRIEVAAEDATMAWRYVRFYVMAMETVLDRYPGLLVSRHIVDLQNHEHKRHRVNLAAQAFGDALRLDNDEASVRVDMPWMPPDFNWFLERAWKDPSILQRLRTRELVRQTVDKLDVLRRLVVSGDKRRRFPALWTLDYDETKKTITLKMMSDLSGICYHVPIEIQVPPAFLAEYGTWLKHGLSICSSVVPKLLSLPILQKVFEAAQPVLATQVEHAQRVHNLIDSLDVPLNGSFESADCKLPPNVAMLMLHELLKLHDESFDELMIAQVANLECAATTDNGHYVWAHRHEILELKGKLELCDPGPIQQVAPSSTRSPSALTLRLSITGIKGLAVWDWRRVYCTWQLCYGENASPIASGQTSEHEDSTVKPAWSDAVFELSCVASVDMLRECRLVVYVMRPSRFLGTTKTVDEGSVWLRDFLAKDAAASFQCEPVTVALDSASPSRRYVSCELSN